MSVSLRAFEDRLRRVQRQHEHCLRLPLVVLMFASFLMRVDQHVDVNTTHQLESALVHSFTSPDHKLADFAFEDIHTASEYWEWMTGVFIPVRTASAAQGPKPEVLADFRTR